MVVWMLCVAQKRIAEGLLRGGYLVTFDAVLQHLLVGWHGWSATTLFVSLLVTWMVVVGGCAPTTSFLLERMLRRNMDTDTLALLFAAACVAAVVAGLTIVLD